MDSKQEPRVQEHMISKRINDSNRQNLLLVIVHLLLRTCSCSCSWHTLFLTRKFVQTSDTHLDIIDVLQRVVNALVTTLSMRLHIYILMPDTLIISTIHREKERGNGKEKSRNRYFSDCKVCQKTWTNPHEVRQSTDRCC